jgi:CRISPR-associated endonuclease Csn1
MARIFGFDIGTTSIGFAAIDHDPEQATGQILRLGVRIFPEARDPDGTPLNQTRRAKRMARRQLRRRRDRRRDLNQALAEAGLLPAFADRAAWHRAMLGDPYELRKRGISEELTLHEFGRALYHLAKRRHFKGRDLADEAEIEVDEKPDEKAAKSDREATLAALRSSDQTLGAWLAGQPHGARKRGHHATRDVVEAEFQRLWNAQAAFHPALTNVSLRDGIARSIFAQRPVFWRLNTLGECRLEPGAALCPKGAWLSQQRRMLEKLNNLAIAGGNNRPLDAEERAAILAKLQGQGSMSWSKVRSELEPIFKNRGESAKRIKFNLEMGGEKGLLGNPLEQKLGSIFGKAWPGHPQRDRLRRDIADLLWQADYGQIAQQRVVILPEAERRRRREAVYQKLMAEYAVAEAEARALVELSLPTGWEPYSTVALERILPELERGVRFGALVNGPEYQSWRDLHFPNRQRPTGEVRDRLPSPRDREEARRIAQLRNPTVVRAQNELRKVVNNLIGLFGKPDLIRIELAREVGKSKREREEMKIALRKQEKRRNDARKDLQSKGIAEPSHKDIEKWLLWKESQEQCPYTGDHIGFDALFRDNRFQVEHIWPRSISLDDSFRNKTLCRADVNIAKGNRTPFQHFGGRPEEWERIRERLGKLLEARTMPPGKVKRFLAESIPDDFAARQLTDTGYAARQAMEQLRRLWPDLGPEAPVTVQAVNGRATAQLRKRWGLNNILSDDGEKTRADHRHHAIDALTVACAHGGYAQRLAAFFKAERESRTPHLPEPWEGIRRDAERAVAEIVVSHRVRKKVSGPLHKETVYGDTGRHDAATGTYRLFVTRKNLSAMTKSEIFSDDPEVGIADPAVRRIVQDWVTSHGGDPKKAFDTYPRVSADGPEIRRARLVIKQQQKLMAPASTGFADLGNNHHIAIFRYADGKVTGEVVSLFEAARRLARREAIVRRARTDGAQFLMSLAPGDTIRFNDGERKGDWVVQGIWAAGPIVLWSALDATGSTVFRPNAASIVKSGAVKLAVDPIGRVRPARD